MSENDPQDHQPDVQAYLCNQYLIRFIFVIYIQPIMPYKKAVRNITISGTSKIIPVSTEVKELGLGPKDTVVAYLAIPGSLEEYALDLATTFCNQGAYYVNEKYLTSKDCNPAGHPFENMLDDTNRTECELIANRLAALNYMIDTMRSYTKTMVSGPYAYYAEDLRTFVAKFDPSELVDDDEVSRNIKNLMTQINVLRACLNTPLFDFSPLDSVKHLQDYMDRALEDAVRLFHCAPEKREEECSRLNQEWQDEVNKVIYRDMYFIGLKMNRSEGGFTGRPEFSVISAPTHRMALESFSDENSQSYAFGPYMDESECSELVSYLRLKWKLEIKQDSDQSTVVQVKNLINEYNVMSGE